MLYYLEHEVDSYIAEVSIKQHQNIEPALFRGSLCSTMKKMREILPIV